MFSLESSRWGDSNENTQHTFMLKQIENISLLCLLTGPMINTPKLELTLSRTHFNGSKGVRAIEVLLYLYLNLWRTTDDDDDGFRYLMEKIQSRFIQIYLVYLYKLRIRNLKKD